MKTFLTQPEQEGPHHAVVLYMDAWGLREELFDLARRVAVWGIAAPCRTSITGSVGACEPRSATPHSA